jgi:hypothetical protein
MKGIAVKTSPPSTSVPAKAHTKNGKHSDGQIGQLRFNAHSELKKDGLTKRPTLWVKRPNRCQVTDEALAGAAAEAIEWLTTVPQETITVTARNGWLYLEGKGVV